MQAPWELQVLVEGPELQVLQYVHNAVVEAEAQVAVVEVQVVEDYAVVDMGREFAAVGHLVAAMDQGAVVENQALAVVDQWVVGDQFAVD